MSFDDRLLSQCVGCGFCLPACPTFQVTRLEQHGPRGRITAMRLVHGGELPVDDADYFESMETCVQCRACEPACPSGVQFGELMEEARAAMHQPPGRKGTEYPPAGRSEGPIRRAVTEMALLTLASRALVRVVSVVLSVAQMLRFDRALPPHWRMPRRVRLREMFQPLGHHGPRDGSPEAHLFRGCVMDAWFRPVHRASIRVLEHAGLSVATEPSPPCCGAIHLHMGREDHARRIATRVIDAFRGTEGPIVVNSAGCGATMKEYGRLVGTLEAERFAARVQDFSEAVSSRPVDGFAPLDREVVYQAACHLKNVQRKDPDATRALSAIPGLRVHRPKDGELCCGAGGAYALVKPEFASAMRDRKVAALQAGGPREIVSTNPGCMLHLSAVGLTVRHVAELLDEALPPTSATEEPSER